ncbi:hypothetical protein K505DRAFT_326227 [Melanomma pulvis-pyrius CBS 109.77]|uniref:Uncharacterized protein n=1 Tax=Melanomma pulvis-pyrius CBS 109.77 TaxID=1314802 RepID=A0A6A6X7L7_9PLEO|nr:hypothetical protein K505DRAFT_326227 [Melanomma pulvis-pyrius CBS 109.77]
MKSAHYQPQHPPNISSQLHLLFIPNQLAAPNNRWLIPNLTHSPDIPSSFLPSILLRSILCRTNKATD